MRNKKTGFTLIELIVSVTIIAVLTVVGVVSYTGTSKKARDSRRMADLEKIRVGLELYRQGVGPSYPSNLPQLVTDKYLQEVPIGPKGSVAGDIYIYTPSNANYDYVLKTNLNLEETGVGYSVTNP
jgi:prepilin-type N-terminal cleavage/methylation domain-containing protein